MTTDTPTGNRAEARAAYLAGYSAAIDTLGVYKNIGGSGDE